MMNNYMTYLIEVNFCLILLAGIYYLFLKNETDFKFRRFYLLITLMVSFGAPFLKLGGFNITSSEVVNSFPMLILPELVIGGGSMDTTVQTTTPDTTPYMTIGYLVVSAIFLQLFLFRLMQVFWFAFSKKTNITRSNGVYLIETKGALPTFSFFKLLFFDNSLKLSQNEREKIIEHELAHIQQKHSFDIILFELAKALTWFNPVSWFIRNEIQDVHEYLADESVLRNSNKEEYGSLLARVTLNQAHLSIGHHFSKSKTLKRLKMMETLKQNVKLWKTFMIIPFFALTAIVVSCNDEVMQDIDNVMETATQTEIPESLMAEFALQQKKYPNADLVYMEADVSSEESVQKLKDIDPNTIAFMEVFKEQNKIGIILNRNGPIRDITSKPDENGIFTIVEKAAEPIGGYEAYYQAIAKEIKYPEQAKKLGVHGKVYVQFVIDKTGEMQDVKVARGIGAGCDAEAVRAITAVGSWTAPMQDGQPVNQRIILPVTFALPGNPSKIELGEASESEEITEFEVLDENKLMDIQLTYVNGVAMGKVLAPSGKPLPGVNIVIKGKSLGTVSDIEGKFKLTAQEGEKLVFSFIGYHSHIHNL